MSNKRKLLFIGPYPEPKGGVSIHIERLQHYLQSEYSIEIIDDTSNRKEGILNTRSFRIFDYLKIIKRADLVHIHSGILLFKILHILSCYLLRKKIIFTYHSTPQHNNGLEFRVNKFLLSKCDVVVFVNEETKAMFQLKKQDVYVQNAFLPPFDIEETLPVEVIKWFDNQKERYIFCANGWKLTYHKGEDLYGLDLCIELVKRLIDQGINCSLIFTISKLNSEGILEKNLQKIQEYNLTDYIYISTCSLPFIEVIKKSAIVLRPTNTDGDALTIREALFFGKKVVASDVVKRPEGTIVFKTRDIKDFVAIVKNTLFEKTPIISDENKPNTDKLLAFYKNLYEEN